VSAERVCAELRNALGYRLVMEIGEAMAYYAVGDESRDHKSAISLIRAIRAGRDAQSEIFVPEAAQAPSARA
jgi:hypothetical protein